MRLFQQLFWILFFSAMGELISALVSNWVVIPGSVIGLLLLFIALHWGFIKIKQVDTVGNWLIANMGLFFVPAGVALLDNFASLSDAWWQLLVIIIVTTLLTMIIVGRWMQWQLKERREVKSHDR